MIQKIDALVNTEIELLLIASLFRIAFITIIITYIDCSLGKYPNGWYNCEEFRMLFL